MEKRGVIKPGLTKAEERRPSGATEKRAADDLAADVSARVAARVVEKRTAARPPDTEEGR